MSTESAARRPPAHAARHHPLGLPQLFTFSTAMKHKRSWERGRLARICALLGTRASRPHLRETKNLTVTHQVAH